MTSYFWNIVGFTGVALFSLRWVIQVIASRQAQKSVLPVYFWYTSISGSLLLMAYFSLGKKDLVGFLANLFPFFLALYNLSFVSRK